MPTKGTYPKGYPEGAIVHYTAGVQRPGYDDIMLGIRNDFAYMLIDSAGVVYQAHPLNHWGYHCGESSWPGLGEWLSSRLVGIEIACAGILNSVHETWFNVAVPPEQVRQFVPDGKNQTPGAYQIYTAAQETSLLALLKWLHANGNGIFDFNNVLGHDEVAPKRKQDPGGSLSMTMPEYRRFLNNQV
jgi:N-acetyl-anhydromuramyl-L-alanine amidase AmpD